MIACPWILLATFVAIGVGVVVGIMRCRKNRQAVARWRGRPTMADRDFLRRCDIPDESRKADVALAVRRAIAGLGTVPAESIRPEDSILRDLADLPFWDRLDWLVFVLEVERHLEGKVKLPRTWIDDAVRRAGGYRAGLDLRVEHIVQAVVAAVCCPKKAALDEEW